MKKLLLLIVTLIAHNCFPSTTLVPAIVTPTTAMLQDTNSNKKSVQEKLYANSVKESEVQKSSMNFHNNKARLVAINPWNERLIWKDKNKTEILMVSWMSEWAANNFYKPYLGKQTRTNNNSQYLSWVTAEPEVRDFAKSYKPTADLTLHDRLNQRLGLPPTEASKYFVQMWVRPEDLFRPCLDSEVLDDRCFADLEEKDLPEGFKDISKFLSINPEHKKWFYERKKNSYLSGPNAFPWTRLGYTYDWGNPTDHVGFSEFAIKPSSTIEIINIIATDNYAQSALPAHLIESSALNQ